MPNAKLNIAAIGLGAQGQVDLQAIAGDSGVNILALCDVDAAYAGSVLGKYPQARRYTDFHKLFDELDKSIDAVVVATPDHSHSVVAMAAIKRKKHVYCEKPLAHSVYEVRRLAQAARQYGVITQLGNQGHSMDSMRIFRQWVEDGAIGGIHTIHAGCSSNYSRINQLSRLAERHAVPATLDWDLWLGPALARPYHPMYLPGRWRGWMPFGTGVIGDWLCHVVDPVFWALDLGAPSSILANAKGYDPKIHGDTFPEESQITFEFPAKGKRQAVTLIWHDGIERLPRPKELGNDRITPDTGAVVLGDNGGITYGPYGAGGLRIFPEEKMKAYQEKLRAQAGKGPIVRPPVGHHQNFLAAIRNGSSASSDFSYGAPLTEIALLGVIASRLPGMELKWDGAAGTFTNSPEANRMLEPACRPGWLL